MIHLILQVDRFEIFFRIELIRLNEIVAKLNLRSVDIVDKNYENQGLKITKINDGEEHLNIVPKIINGSKVNDKYNRLQDT